MIASDLGRSVRGGGGGDILKTKTVSLKKKQIGKRKSLVIRKEKQTTEQDARANAIVATQVFVKHF
ncbi:hypothetical protein Ga0100230_014920 [Opitutaceae bacterium TAV3]|nr:hypothetical protein Ga0100230_014920 [Opitutaceae bacterium TAV3]